MRVFLIILIFLFSGHAISDEVYCEDYDVELGVQSFCLINVDGKMVPHGKNVVRDNTGVIVLLEHWDRGVQTGFSINRDGEGNIITVCYHTPDKAQPDCIDIAMALND